MNNATKDIAIDTNELRKDSPIVEVFQAMSEGKEITLTRKVGDEKGTIDRCVEKIKELGQRSLAGDAMAISEINALRRFTIEKPLTERLKLLNIFGSYQSLGYNETPYAESDNLVGEATRFQALNGDVPFAARKRSSYPVPMGTVSGGYITDYRRMSMGDMSAENAGMEQVRTEIYNKALLYVMNTVITQIENAEGVKYFATDNGITKTNLDRIIKNVRRFGKPTIAGDYSVVSQINSLIPYSDGSTPAITGVSQAAMDEIRQTGLLSSYNGSAVVEIPNVYELGSTEKDKSGERNFKPLLPENILFVLPSGVTSPIKSWTRGGLTTFTGNDVATGQILTRFDLEVGADIAKGEEYKVGLIKDTSI